ncbi:hypothetical protein KIN20_029447 [Parelaphostrongylus tenuis]|uniref:Uncharacterized protein n=1 Tax=Parelaphostrongylus tenuis TaxID=148309 RepID=A0AAD5R2F4_PARTN|nr:hypothetical protein KIN20_029447 [Parelaphostrongylus tenuis]
MATLLKASLMILLLTTISIALGCGVTPAGQTSTRSFTVSGFTLNVAMAYAGKPEFRPRFLELQLAGIEPRHSYNVL